MATSFDIQKKQFILNLKNPDNIKMISDYVKTINNMAPTANLDSIILHIINMNVSDFFVSDQIIFDDAIFKMCNDYIKKNCYSLYLYYSGIKRVRFQQPHANHKVSIHDIKSNLNNESDRSYNVYNVNKYNRIKL